jgi:hypothetical protein
MKKVTILLFLMAATNLLLAQNQSIKDLLDNPGLSLRNKVKIQGTILQYVPAGTTNTAFYIIVDDLGGEIIVQTPAEGIPETFKKYKVEGYFNFIDSKYIIQETSRQLLEATPAPAPEPAPTPTRERTQPAPTPAPAPPPPPPAKDNTLLYVIIAVAAVLIILVIIMSKKKQEPATTAPQTHYPPAPETQPISPVTQPIHTTGSSGSTGGFTTIRIETAPKTMRFIPGKFTITSDEDKGMSFNIAGYPTPEGAMVTIGRESVSGERSYAHIKIDDKFKTVSRKQAELLHSDRMLYIRNKSEANYTQVDGFELKPGEKRELKSGSKIRMGELELMYSV